MALTDLARAVGSAFEKLDQDRLARLICDLVDIHSPTGHERCATQFLATHFSSLGLSSRHYDLGEKSGAVAAHTPGHASGSDILLYAPIDTHLSADDRADIPWVGDQLRADMVPKALREGEDYLIGLGASNPKSMIAVLCEAVAAILDAGLELPGKLRIASAGGGMPWRPGGAGGVGLSSGVNHLLSNGLRPDAAIIMKPWDEVYYEHPGLAWFKVSVKGDLGYAGIPHGVPGFKNSIAPAAKLMRIFQSWLEAYPDRHESAQVRPEGWIGAVQAGWPEKPAFPPATTSFWMDIRLSPNQTLEDLCDEVDGVLTQAMADHDEIDASWSLEASMPAGRTQPDHLIVKAAQAAWEAQHRRPYPGAPKMAGQTDAAMIALHGVPIVRIGFPFLGPDQTPEPYRAGLGGMGVAYLPDLMKAAEMTIRTALTALYETEQGEA